MYEFESFIEQAENRLTVTQAAIEDPASYRCHVKEGRELLDASIRILFFLETVDTSHPSINAYRWRTAVNSALREYTARDLQPIVWKIDRLENALWRRENLYAYSWREFEELVGSLYRSKGYQVTVTAGTNDGGVDVWARNQSDIIAIQVKQYSHGNTVGRPDLQRIVSTLATGEATKVAVVTSSTFSSTAYDYAAQFGSRIELIDGDSLIAVLSESSLPPAVTESQEQASQ